MAKQRIIAITGASGGLAQEIVKQLSPSDRSEERRVGKEC